MKWNPTVHATTRLKERFDIEPGSAQNFVNQIMDNAKYVNTQPDGKMVYYYEKRDMFIIVNKSEGNVITVHKGTEKSKVNSPKITVSSIVKAVQRELKRMSTQYQREIRKLTEQHAELAVVVAQLTLNKIKCDAPHTKALLDERISELNEKLTLISKEIDVKNAELASAEKQVSAVIGE